jgi:hypothetical protein
MAKPETPVGELCPSCGHVDAGPLQRCQMCRSLFCQHCGVFGYGRYFCSDQCCEFFFHGDPDEIES